MSAKKNSQPARPAPTPVAATPVAAAAVATAPVAAPPSWLESSDPRRRLIAKIVLAAVWIYVAALWLLALDQWFNWGIFGPKVTPVP